MVTKSEHEKERRAFWDACCAQVHVPRNDDCSVAEFCAAIADEKLAERDKRFPAPESEEK